jgi:hypothetical protein
MAALGHLIEEELHLFDFLLLKRRRFSFLFVAAFFFLLTA